MVKKPSHYLTLFGFTAGVLLLIFTIFLNYNNFKLKNEIENISSRIAFEKAMDFVKQEKPTPPITAIFYAEVSKNIFENKEGEFREILNDILEKEKNLPKTILKKGNEKNEYWIGENPLSPNIGKYTKYFLDNSFKYKLPPPPKYNSAEFKENLKIVKEVSSMRTTEHGAIINFFGGVPGTEQPAGIWQNILWNNVLTDFYSFKNLKIENKEIRISEKELDKKYAYIQMILAKSVADSFVKTWEEKYIHQTKRPNMTDKSINITMDNPNFPGYVSGHSTISATAAVILGYFFPEKIEVFVEDSENAKNSRLWAGIHFTYDNDEGYKFGEEIGKFIVEKLEK